MMVTVKASSTTVRHPPIAIRAFSSLLSVGVNDLWPGFRPYDGYAIKFARYWFVQAAQNPVVSAAILFGSASHRHIRTSLGRAARSSYHIERYLQLKGVAMRTIRELFMKQIAPESMGELIYAVLCLAASQNLTTSTLRLPDKTKFQPLPLESQWLMEYGSFEFDSTHSTAIQALVQHAGGITNIHGYSVGWLVFL